MNPSKYKSVSMRKDAWELATVLSKSIVPNVSISRSQVVEIALKRMSKDINNNIDIDVKLKKVNEPKLNLKAPDPKYVGTVTTHAEVLARNTSIYYFRCLAPVKMTLQQLGTCYNLSRERVRQIQERMENEVSAETLKQTQEDKHASNN